MSNTQSLATKKLPSNQVFGPFLCSFIAYSSASLYYIGSSSNRIQSVASISSSCVREIGITWISTVKLIEHMEKYCEIMRT